MMDKGLLSRLTRVFSPTGREEEVAGIIKSGLDKKGFKVRQDALGNVVATKGEEPYQIICTHMDQPGWVAEHRDKKGMLHLKSVPKGSELGQGWAVDKEGERYVVFERDKTIIAEPLTGGKGAIGDFLVASGELFFSQNKVAGPSLSDRFGISVLLEAAEKISFSAALVFYVSRHLGFMGLSSALADIQIKDIFVLEPYPESPDYPEPGKGPVIITRTSSSIAPPGSVHRIKEIARAKGIDIQDGMIFEQRTGPDVLSRKGLGALGLGLCIGFAGSRIERLSLSDYQGLKSLVTVLANQGGG